MGQTTLRAAYLSNLTLQLSLLKLNTCRMGQTTPRAAYLSNLTLQLSLLKLNNSTPVIHSLPIEDIAFNYIALNNV